MTMIQIIAFMVLSFTLGNLAGYKSAMGKVEQIIRETTEELEGK